MSTAPMVKYWTEEEQKRLLAAPARLNSLIARRDTAWMHLLVLTGLRVAEFSQLSVAAVESALATGWLFIPKQHRKKKKGKSIDLEKLVTVELRRWLVEALAVHREMGGAGAGDAPLVLTGEGERLSVRSYQARVKHWCRAAGMRAGSPHWFRHTRAMNIVRRTTCVDAARLMLVVTSELGHADPRSASVYVGLSKEDLAAAAAQADGATRMTRKAARKYYDVRRPA